MPKSNITIFVKYYLPGYKSGGPIKTIKSLVSTFEKKINFSIVTSDRDAGDHFPYKNIKQNKWVKNGLIRINYTTNNFVSYLRLINEKSIRDSKLIYFNSFFSFKYTILPLIFFKFISDKKTKILIAPRGEFSPEALKIKRIRKLIYLFIFKKIISFSSIFFQASNSKEYKNIKDMLFESKEKIFIARNLSEFKYQNKNFEFNNYNNDKNRLNLLFFSRIAKMKNLKFLINLLLHLDIKFKLHIYGPVVDDKYWNDCLKELKKYNNISQQYEYFGPVDSNIPDIFLKMDFFLLPTLGENFGHTIFESLSNGVPVIISDRTDWHLNSFANESIISLPLHDKKIWQDKILELSKIDIKKKQYLRKKAISFIKQYCEDNKSLHDHNKLFKKLKVL